MRDWFQKAWAKTGKKLDMGKACIRFKKVDDLALDVVAEAIRRVTTAKYVAQYLAIRKALAGRKVKGPPDKPSSGKSAHTSKSAVKKSTAAANKGKKATASASAARRKK